MKENVAAKFKKMLKKGGTVDASKLSNKSPGGNSKGDELKEKLRKMIENKQKEKAELDKKVKEVFLERIQNGVKKIEDEIETPPPKPEVVETV